MRSSGWPRSRRCRCLRRSPARPGLAQTLLSARISAPANHQPCPRHLSGPGAGAAGSRPASSRADRHQPARSPPPVPGSPVELNRRHRPRLTIQGNDEHSVCVSRLQQRRRPPAPSARWGSSDSAGRDWIRIQPRSAVITPTSPPASWRLRSSRHADGSGSSSNDNVPPDEALRDGPWRLGDNMPMRSWPG